MESMNLLLGFLTFLLALFTLVNGLEEYKKDTKRKAQQDTIDAYIRLQKEVLSQISKLRPKEVKLFCNNTTCEQYKIFTEYLIEIECFCIGLEEGIYDKEVFFSLAKDYFNNKKGAIRPKMEIMIEKKKNLYHNADQYFKNLESIWSQMDAGLGAVGDKTR